ncbi:hypothetical protein EDB80DRAFT_866177 [Ilyonectria destructans]|nr:hypothetical protein EDB80DRAFT_866177 [Ilyonectria destructans]
MEDVIANPDPIAPLDSSGYVEYPSTGMVSEAVGWCAFMWLLIRMCMFKGVGTTGWVVYFTMGLPVVMLIAMLGRSLSLILCWGFEARFEYHCCPNRTTLQKGDYKEVFFLS